MLGRHVSSYTQVDHTPKTMNKIIRRGAEHFQVGIRVRTNPREATRNQQKCPKNVPFGDGPLFTDGRQGGQTRIN